MRIVIALLALVILAGVAPAQYPRGVVAEDATATWCQYCPYAYEGLEVMKARYDATEFNAIRYYATSGGLGTTETNGRISYYNIGGFPTVMFDGTIAVVGGSAEIATGSSYDPIVAKNIGQPSPFHIQINSVDVAYPDGSVNFDVIVEEALADIGNVKIRAMLLENNVPWGSSDIMQDVTRDVLPDVVLTVSQLGQTQNVQASFPLDAAWKTNDLWLAILIQDDDDKSILQSRSSRPDPAYSIRYWKKGSSIAVRPPASGVHEFQEMAIYNLGTNPDVIRATIDPGTIPADWSFVLSDGVNEYSTFVDVSLAPGEGRIFQAKMSVGDSGHGVARVVLTSDHLPGTIREIPYGVVTDDLQVLVVDDDGAQNYESLHAAALDALGVTYGIWPRAIAEVAGSDLMNFDLVAWGTALSYPTLDAADRAALGAYLDAGGKLFLSGQEIGWEMNDTGGPAIAWYNQYLHANFVSDDANQNVVNGISGDPISNGLSIPLTAALNPYPDIISPRDGMATPIFNYGSGTNRAGLKVDTGVYKLVYLGFGYEAITAEANRTLLMQRVLGWLDSASSVDDPMTARLSVRAFPNPAAGPVELSWNLPSAAEGSLEIYGANGALVRTLRRGGFEAGLQRAVWDGRDNRGATVPSGIYFYRLRAAGEQPSGRIVLAR